MNEHDEEVGLLNVFSRFPKLKEFFIENEPDIKNLILFASDDVLQRIISQIAEIAQEKVWEVISEWEQNDDYYYQQMQEEYGDEDGDIDWDKVHEAGDDYLQWNDEARKFEIDMKDAINPTPKELKSYVYDHISTGEEEERMAYIHFDIANLVSAAFPRRRVNDGGIPKFLRTKIDVVKSGDEWVVRRT